MIWTDWLDGQNVRELSLCPKMSCMITKVRKHEKCIGVKSKEENQGEKGSHVIGAGWVEEAWKLFRQYMVGVSMYGHTFFFILKVQNK